MEDFDADDQIDVEFGKFIRHLRMRAGLTLERAAHTCQMDPVRLFQVELGEGQGITKDEAVLLSELYDVDCDHVLRLAAGDKSFH